MYPPMLRWTFSVLYVALTFCLPGLRRLYFLFFSRLIWEFTAVVGVGDAGVNDARMIPLLVDSMVEVSFSIVVDLAHFVPALSALIVLLLLHVLSIALKPLPLVLWIRLLVLS